MALEFRKAQRKSTPMLISLSAVSGGGKTYSALLMAAGIAGDKGRVGFIDTENGRGEMYADSPGIMRALPNGYDYLRFDPPFSPARYIEHIQAAERAGITVCVIDSGTHEWEGIGGCCEIAEKNKLRNMPNWAKAKIEHKKFVNQLLSSPMHIIFCLRARDKVKVFKAGDSMILHAGEVTEAAPVAEKDCIVPIGLEPVCEKSFVFEMLLSLKLDERSHCAIPIKVPEPLMPLFQGKRLITKEDGERIRRWNDTGSAMGEFEQLEKRARLAADGGVAAYSAFFKDISATERKHLASTTHTENKRIAEAVDREAKGVIPEVSKLPDAVEEVAGTQVRYQGKVYTVTDSDEGQRWVCEEVAA